MFATENSTGRSKSTALVEVMAMSCDITPLLRPSTAMVCLTSPALSTSVYTMWGSLVMLYEKKIMSPVCGSTFGWAHMFPPSSPLKLKSFALVRNTWTESRVTLSSISAGFWASIRARILPPWHTTAVLVVSFVPLVESASLNRMLCSTPDNISKPLFTRIPRKSLRPASFSIARPFVSIQRL